MSRHRVTVVLSQAQGKHPGKRALEESLIAALLGEPGLDVSVVPYLYDLDKDHSGRLFLESVQGDMVVLSWMFPRATFWVLDRDGIKGHWGESQLKSSATDEEDETEEEAPNSSNGIGSVNVPDRHIYCLDLRDFNSHDVYVQEVRRIATECWERQRSNQQPVTSVVTLGLSLRPDGNGNGTNGFTPEALLQQTGRRWYPVIDYSRCTNCMECIDFCLFGVYGVDGQERILVENQDSCKRGCPACSRVCPEQAIIFPDYKSPAIAGAPVGAITGLKIDLTKLFGGDGKSALEQAADERDRELVADGRAAVGLTVGIPKRQANKSAQPKDDLDTLMDALDALDL
jgi:NAD-dependent dihydropyrimidine dehydrogenase PreA subunit